MKIKKINKPFHPTDVSTSKMSKKYLFTLIKNIKYKVRKYLVTVPFRLWWFVGDKLKFKGVSYVDKVMYLVPLKKQLKEIIE